MEANQIRQLELYQEMVVRYHATLDLLSARGVGDLDRFVAEAVEYAKLVRQVSPAVRTVVDLGSGAGLPGVPLAILLPEYRVVLVERRRRRSTFLRTVTAHLGLRNASVESRDVRDLTGPPAGVVTAQAVGTFQAVYELSCHLHAEKVWLVSRKGPEGPDELRTLAESLGSDVEDQRVSGLGRRGSLFAALIAGGLACPPSG